MHIYQVDQVNGIMKKSKKIEVSTKLIALRKDNFKYVRIDDLVNHIEKLVFREEVGLEDLLESLKEVNNNGS